jgi:hypothetical protein
MCRTRSPCCARAASGHATALPSPAMNSLRRIRDLPPDRGSLSRGRLQGNGVAVGAGRPARAASPPLPPCLPLANEGGARDGRPGLLLRPPSRHGSATTPPSGCRSTDLRWTRTFRDCMLSLVMTEVERMANDPLPVDQRPPRSPPLSESWTSCNGPRRCWSWLLSQPASPYTARRRRRLPRCWASRWPIRSRGRLMQTCGGAQVPAVLLSAPAVRLSNVMGY